MSVTTILWNTLVYILRRDLENVYAQPMLPSHKL